MAEASELEIEEAGQHLVECVNCCENEGYLLNPKLLPCGHIFCVTCIAGHQRDPHKIVCYKCKSTFQTTIDELQSALGDLKTFCDTCVEKEGESFMTANVYCMECKMKYCNRHHKVHDTLNSHTLVTIKEYLKASFAEEQRYCHDHKTEIYSLGCEQCYEMFCSECVNSPTECGKDGSHQVVSLKKLVNIVKAMVEPQKAELEDQLDEVSAVVKEATILMSGWDTETEHGRRQIMQTRERHLAELNRRYDRLEALYVEDREVNKEKITDYITEGAGRIQAQHLQQLKRLRADLTYRHPVDVVRERLFINERIEELMCQAFPRLTLENMPRLVPESTQTDMQLDLVSDEPLSLGDKVRTNVRLPSHLKLVRDPILKKEDPLAVCGHRGCTYIGHTGNGIDRVDEEGRVQRNFIKLQNAVVSIRAHKDRIFVLEYGQPYKILTYHLSGDLISKRDHSDRNDSCVSGNKMIVVQDHLVVCDLSHQQVIGYPLEYFSPESDTKCFPLRALRCLLISKGTHVSICKVNDGSAVISNYKANLVFRFSLDLASDFDGGLVRDGHVDWEAHDVTNPEGVVCNGEKYVLVTAPTTDTTIWILDSQTGAFLQKLSAPAGSPMRVFTERSHVYDLFINDGILVVPRRNHRRVCFYLLMREMKALKHHNSHPAAAVENLM